MLSVLSHRAPTGFGSFSEISITLAFSRARRHLSCSVPVEGQRPGSVSLLKGFSEASKPVFSSLREADVPTLWAQNAAIASVKFSFSLTDATLRLFAVCFIGMFKAANAL